MGVELDSRCSPQPMLGVLLTMKLLHFMAGCAVLGLVSCQSPARFAEAEARFLSEIVCDGNVEWHPLKAYTEINSHSEEKPSCIFITRSRIGRKILKICPKDSLCLVKANIENGSGEYEIIKLISVKRVYDTYVKEPPCILYKNCDPKAVGPQAPPPY